MKLSVRVVVVVACGLVALSSCSLQATHGGGLMGIVAHPPTQHGVGHHYGSGPISFTVRASSTTINTAQTLNLKLVAESKTGWAVQLPAVGRKLGDFVVAARSFTQPHLSSGATTERSESFELEPFLPGAYVVPPLTLSATNGSAMRTVSSDPIRVTVTPLIPNGTKRQLKLKALAGPGPELSVWPEVIAGASVLIAALAATVMMFIGRIRQRRRLRASAVPPWVRARKELDRIIHLDLTSNGRHKEFYNRISLLARRYIEEMFDVNDPEQTTEEFLYTVRDSTALGRHRRFLGEFLSHCDLVKFADYLPAQDEVHRAVRSCREFIDSTSRDYSEWPGEGSNDR